MRAFRAKLLFERRDEGLKEVQYTGIASANAFAQMLIDNRADHNRALAVPGRAGVNLRDGAICRLGRIDERNGRFAKFKSIELTQQRIAHRFSRDAGLV